MTPALPAVAKEVKEPLAADSPLTIVVAGANGRTGQRVLERLAAQEGMTVIGGVRDVEKAKKKFTTAPTNVEGGKPAVTMQSLSVDPSRVRFAYLDVARESVDEMAQTLQGAHAIVSCLGFRPREPFEMAKEAHAVDNVGGLKLIDAARTAGVSKVVMLSSILTDAVAWGKQNTAGFRATNTFFGGVLNEKLVAEQYLRSSGLDYTIVRSASLIPDPPRGDLVISGENTVSDFEISRELVANVLVDAISDPRMKNKVIEIYEKRRKTA
jgi:uncharacterized protein YbjT (DUF2867 family)